MISDVPPALPDSGGPQTALSGRRGFLETADGIGVGVAVGSALGIPAAAASSDALAAGPGARAAGGNPFVTSIYTARLGDTPCNWIGRSQNPADPYLAGAVDDFRIYQSALSRAELAELTEIPRQSIS